MSVICIIQARMGSTRFPGTMLALLDSHPVIWHVYTRCKQAVPNTVIATMALRGDDILAEYLRTIDAPVFRWDGPETDVLGRYAACLKTHPADWVVRVTGDCPLIDPIDIRATLASAQHNGVAYTTLHCPSGFNVEVYRASMLRYSAQLDTDPERREHVKLMPLVSTRRCAYSRNSAARARTPASR